MSQIKNIEQTVNHHLSPFVIGMKISAIVGILALSILALGLLVYFPMQYANFSLNPVVNQFKRRSWETKFWHCQVEQDHNETISDFHCEFRENSRFPPPEFNPDSNWGDINVPASQTNLTQQNSAQTPTDEELKFKKNLAQTLLNKTDKNTKLILNRIQEIGPNILNHNDRKLSDVAFSADSDFFLNGDNEGDQKEYKPLFITINNNPFLLSQPPLVSSIIRNIFFVLLILASHCIFAVVVIWCVKRRSDSRISNIIGEKLHTQQLNSFFTIKIHKSYHHLKVVLLSPCLSNQNVHSYAINFQQTPETLTEVEHQSLTQPVNEEPQPINQIKTKKMKYVLVSDNLNESGVNTLRE